MFDETDIYEIHGNVETWQCSGNARSSRNVCPQLHALPKSIQFDINRETMLADITDITDRLQCGCQQRLRPNVLMFHDHQWIPNHLAEVCMYSFLYRDSSLFVDDRKITSNGKLLWKRSVVDYGNERWAETLSVLVASKSESNVAFRYR